MAREGGGSIKLHILKQNRDYLDDMQLGQKVAVSQRQLLPVQIFACGFSGLSLVGQWGGQVVVQLSQSLFHTLLQSWTHTHMHTTGTEGVLDHTRTCTRWSPAHLGVCRVWCF